MEIEDTLLSSQSQTAKGKKRLLTYFTLITNSVSQWNCRGLRPNLDELPSFNPLAETFMKDTDNITVGKFNLYHKFHEVKEEPLGGGVPFLSMTIFLRV